MAARQNSRISMHWIENGIISVLAMFQQRIRDIAVDLGILGILYVDHYSLRKVKLGHYMRTLFLTLCKLRMYCLCALFY